MKNNHKIMVTQPMEFSPEELRKLQSLSEMRAEHLWHRATAILVFNSNWELYVHQRTFSKDLWLGYYDIVAGGCVTGEETYLDNAQRELEEELGIAKVELVPLFKNKYETAENRVWTMVYRCTYDSPITTQAEEIISGEYLDASRAKANKLKA